MIPVRCFTCNKVIGNKWEKFKKQLEAGKDRNSTFIELGLSRYCCKRMFLGHVELIDKLILYSPNIDNSSDQKCSNI
jgi:DNA-directed RNA polymerase subunit N (RpoN/RPB10)